MKLLQTRKSELLVVWLGEKNYTLKERGYD